MALAKLQNLSTLSITVDAEGGDAWRNGFWLYLRYLDVLLKALPVLLAYLEVDLAFRDTPGNSGSMYLCPTIRQLLP